MLISNIERLIDQIRENLTKLAKKKIIDNERLVKIELQNDPFSNYNKSNQKILNSENKRLVFHSKDFNSFSICDVLSKNCDFSSNLKQKK